ncbi:hypothetical protein [Acidianus sp. RZ1]|uniref:hypothetical protein n=1 Tax=Acidianus sp. RZ1 TaxID=1540082 RepID=UPI0014926988|nr:hypothetical protein [Acidianus sp. RZ1]NON62114.1 hypothetical protein [Acidianus sp. RZ1]
MSSDDDKLDELERQRRQEEKDRLRELQARQEESYWRWAEKMGPIWEESYRKRWEDYLNSMGSSRGKGVKSPRHPLLRIMRDWVLATAIISIVAMFVLFVGPFVSPVVGTEVTIFLGIFWVFMTLYEIIDFINMALYYHTKVKKRM